MVKVISLSELAYHEMKTLKREGESFSDVVKRLAKKEKKKPLKEFFGIWPGDNNELDNMKKMIEKDRKRFKTREVKF